MNLKPTSYDRGQHELICKALNVSNDPDALGLTAYEAVCVLRMKLEAAQSAINQTLKDNAHIADGPVCTLKAIRDVRKFLKQNPNKVEWIALYGTE